MEEVSDRLIWGFDVKRFQIDMYHYVIVGTWVQFWWNLNMILLELGTILAELRQDFDENLLRFW